MVAKALMTPNDQHQRWEPAAADAGMVSDLNGWLPSAECCGWAFSSPLETQKLTVFVLVLRAGTVKHPGPRLHAERGQVVFGQAVAKWKTDDHHSGTHLHVNWMQAPERLWKSRVRRVDVGLLCKWGPEN